METDGSGGRVARVRVRAVGMGGVGWGGGYRIGEGGRGNHIHATC